MALKKDYSDLKYGFVKNSAGDTSPIYDESSINQSLKTLFFTQKGERFFNLSYGTNIKKILFEPLDSNSARLLNQEIEDAINFFEGKRISLNSIDIVVNYDENSYNIKVLYNILSTSQTGQLNLTLNRG